MSGIDVEWIVILAFVLLFAGAIVAEIVWLARNGPASTGRAVAYVLLTDFLGFGIGSLVLLIIFFIMFMMIMGPAGTGSNVPEAAYWAGLVIAIIVPPVLLIACKRIFLSLFKIRAGKPAWIYAVVSSLLLLLAVLVPPPLIYYVLVHSPLWK